MDFSNRIKKLPDQFFASLVSKVQAAMKEGRDIINLGQGNPDQPTPSHIVEALREAVLDPSLHKYSPFRGLAELKQAAAEFYKREYGVEVDPETEVAVLFGSKTALVELPLIMMNEGDLMLLPDPGYPDYLSGASLASVRHDLMPLMEENDYLPDYNRLSVQQKEDAKLLYLNYPNNPTGAVATKEFFEETVEMAKQYDIGIVHDFAYGAIGFDGKRPISFLQIDGAKDIGVELYTLSKTYNMAGWRIGFAVGNKKIIEGINCIQDHLYVSTFPAVQKAAEAALTSSQQCVEQLIDTYEKRRDAFMAACGQIGWMGQVPPGSFFAWMPVPAGYTSESFADILLTKSGVAVAPGNGFGNFGEGYVRIGLLVEEERLIEAVNRVGMLGLF